MSFVVGCRNESWDFRARDYRTVSLRFILRIVLEKIGLKGEEDYLSACGIFLSATRLDIFEVFFRVY
jgi:hypothetical protein